MLRYICNKNFRSEVRVGVETGEPELMMGLAQPKAEPQIINLVDLVSCKAWFGQST